MAASSGSPHQQAWRQNSWQHIKLVSVNAKLVDPLNSRKATQGQTITAKLTNGVKAPGATELPDGTTLIGKVKQVEVSQNRGPAKISIVFDRARLKNGREIPIKATLLAAYPPVSAYNLSAAASYLPVQPRTISSQNTVMQEPGTLPHVAMQSAVESSISGVFTSKNHNIDLGRGTRLQLAIAPEPASSMLAQKGM
ncbi:MAG: hypothetical protein WA708_11570 [Acidobacteriaceae bacterium]